MKLLVVIHSLDPGGTQRFLANLTTKLLDRGVELTVVTLSLAEIDDFFPMGESVTRHRLSFDRPHDGSLLGKLRRDIASLRGLRAVVRGERPDVVLSLGWSTNVITLAATRMLRIPVVISERVDPRTNPAGRWWPKAQRVFYPFATHLVTQTKTVEDHMRRWVRRGRITTIPNPVPTELFAITRQPGSVPHVVSVCRLSAQKGVDILLSAFAMVRAERPTAVLSLVGDGPDRLELASQAERLGVADAVTFHGMMKDPTVISRTAWVGCLASRSEGFPNALVELMALGLPCVSTDCPSGPAELLNGGAGLLVDVDDAEGLAEALSRLLADPDLRATTGARARERALEFEQDSVVDRWFELLERFAR